MQIVTIVRHVVGVVKAAVSVFSFLAIYLGLLTAWFLFGLFLRTTLFIIC